MPFGRSAWRLLVAALGASVLVGTSGLMADDASASDTYDEADAPPAWCDEGMPRLGEGMCFSPNPTKDGTPRTLVIFLHGVIKSGTTWQHNQQKGFALYAKRYGFTALMPRGRQGVGPKGMRDWWTWPTSAKAQKEVEAAVVEEWMTARTQLEAKDGKPFERVLVAGFSNGAYYASSLALRGRLEVDGYAIFAGGSAPGYLQKRARNVERRPPIYVGYGTKDAAGRDASKLGIALRALGWKHRVEARAGVGHSITDSQFKHAWQFLGASD